VVSRERHYFGDDQVQEALCVVGKGWARETQAWLGSENRFVPQSQIAYDIHGNPVSVIAGGVERRLAYDTDGLFPVEEHVDPSGSDLMWKATWDRVLGSATAVIEPNGH